MGAKGGSIPGRPHELMTTDCQEPYCGEMGTGPVRLEMIPAALLLLRELKVNEK